MSSGRRLHAGFMHSLVLVALLASTPVIALAQDSAAGIPENAGARSDGSGWECDRGYRENDGSCAAVEVPANAYFVEASFGLGWKCDRGYRTVSEACVAVTVPKNAHLDYSGNDWDCNRPYRKDQDGCILLP